ncbi:hypothetical protein WR25_00686 [Diploscapter pachys]|uniref:Uncharacterized protein n=1 Tax=Diploscapter pachys TaxID=2018661 RepID=A0A2A2J9T9_9BILA|nr:hypothetical protein WR25_00686 [Diploscapter pachys]
MEMGPALRSLLPCIDEPSYKATWASSYLVAVVCGHFAYISSISNSGTLVRMVSWAGMEKYGDFTLPIFFLYLSILVMLVMQWKIGA